MSLDQPHYELTDVELGLKIKEVWDKYYSELRSNPKNQDVLKPLKRHYDSPREAQKRRRMRGH